MIVFYAGFVDSCPWKDMSLQILHRRQSQMLDEPSESYLSTQVPTSDEISPKPDQLPTFNLSKQQKDVQISINHHWSHNCTS